MNLTEKEKKLLERCRKAKGKRYLVYIGLMIGFISGIICMIKGIITKNGYSIMTGYFMLILIAVGSNGFYQNLKFYNIIEKLKNKGV